MTSIINSMCLSRKQKETIYSLLSPIYKISKNEDIVSSISFDMVMDELQNKETSKFYCNNKRIYIYFSSDGCLIFHKCGNKDKSCTQYNINIDGIKIKSRRI